MKFEAPKIVVTRFTAEDIIATSFGPAFTVAAYDTGSVSEVSNNTITGNGVKDTTFGGDIWG